MDKVIKEIAKFIGIKILILLSISLSLSALLAYSDGANFFKCMKIMGILFVIMGVAAFVPSERAVISNFQNPNMFTGYKKPYSERMLQGNMVVFSKGGVQVIIAAIIIIGLTFLMEQLI
ncbi:hypothetical protein G9F72_019815 [Clostridium estertheticum]|uniref:hypothetical protein n=1 Tax=Clostridium estertheticum TaxID=238834 RepID=UPI0013E99926|nr:hypothetical protein [Clostridium estertheticum]MBZ9688579.1 hypothetical protein [Clostridium estertheticum]